MPRDFEREIEQLPITETTMHPVNFMHYTAETKPAKEIDQYDAELWSLFLLESHTPELQIHTGDDMTVQEMIDKFAEYKWQAGVWDGTLIAGPLFSDGVVSVKGISLWAPRAESSNGA